MMQRSFFLLLVFIVLFLSGCNRSPATAFVDGTVTFDGKPLVNAEVGFHPVDGSRPSFGMTDASGNYWLQFSPTLKGALPGEHKVVILTAGESDPSNPVRETLPAKYNSASELKPVLKKGQQTINFELMP